MLPPGGKTLTLKLGLERTGKRFLVLLFGNCEKKESKCVCCVQTTPTDKEGEEIRGQVSLLSGAWLPSCKMPTGAAQLNVSRAYRVGLTQHGACSCP